MFIYLKRYLNFTFLLMMIVKSQAPYLQAWWKIVMCKFKNFNQQGKNPKSNQVQSHHGSASFCGLFSPFKVYNVRPRTQIQRFRKMKQAILDVTNENRLSEKVLLFSDTIQFQVESYVLFLTVNKEKPQSVKLH